MRPNPGPAALVALLLVAVAGCTVDVDRRAVEDVIDERTERPFYEIPDPLPPGEPGTLIRSERLFGTARGAVGWRILYHSRDVTGADIAVSGVVLAPDEPATDGSRPVVSWGHPTTGAARHSAPSLGIDPFDTIEGAMALVRAGYVVVATDYPGMGAPGPASYLIGTSEGRSVLDATRAAGHIRATGAGGQLLLWGHSQGGQAVLFAAQEAPTYTPDLELVAVAAAAPAVELAALLRDNEDLPAGVTLGAYAFDAYQQVYGPTHPEMSLDQVVKPAGVPVVPELAGLCLFGQHKELERVAEPLVGEFIAADPATVEPWASLLRDNTPGAVRIDAPMFIAQGTADKLVDPATTRSYVRDMCAAGERVDFHQEPGVGHTLVAERAIPDVVGFFGDALAGRPTADTC